MYCIYNFPDLLVELCMDELLMQTYSEINWTWLSKQVLRIYAVNNQILVMSSCTPQTHIGEYLINVWRLIFPEGCVVWWHVDQAPDVFPVSGVASGYGGCQISDQGWYYTTDSSVSSTKKYLCMWKILEQGNKLLSICIN